ncbi:hypothetical protein GF339_15015 [candidate division KSB3 bacterium]|uniref:PA14 domain-containing protein n=1 Tax=candidate division KSB3 bacterium TaxID=2044937 RepID=A0A9D5JXG8_9BACT|nr:hypothetical protein [candidate division KSB3 bacterium]MBD3325895.1 hypothetical protein [candidate division KSB3 bacterium]
MGRIATGIDVLKRQGVVFLALLLVVGLSLLWILPRRGVVAVYYDNEEWRGTPAISRREPQISLNTVSQRQETFPQRYFSAVWAGWMRIDQEGEYTFFTESDDGSSLYIDGEMVVDNSGIHVSRKAAGTMKLTQGMHFLRIFYVQYAGAYRLRVSWKAPGQAENGIPRDVLYPQPFPLPGLEWITRHRPILYPLSWLLLIAIVVGRHIRRERQPLRGLMKRYAQNLALSLVTILICLLLAEGGIRLIYALRENRKDLELLLNESQETELEGGSRTYSLKGLVQSSPYEGIVYELKPNLKGNFLEVPLTTNSRGLRDYEYSYRKPEQTFRIVGLGDSSLFGWGVRLEETSLKVLERRLNQEAAAMKFEVINFAVPGYNTAIEAEVFVKKCLKYSPDLVIMHFNTNDYDVPGFMKPPQSYSTFRKSYLLDFLYSRYQLLRGTQNQEVIPFVFERTMSAEEAEYLHEDPRFPDEYRHMVGKQGFLRALDTLLEAADAHDVTVLVYVVKSYAGLEPSYTPNEFKLRQLELITRLSQDKGFFLLNTYPYYIEFLNAFPDRTRRDFWVSETDTHPSALAHQIEAEAFYDFLVQHELIPLNQ